jgi:hypothetical protein
MLAGLAQPRATATSLRLAVVAVAWLAAGCSSTAPTPASTTPAVTNAAVASVTISGVRNPMAIGDVEVLKATARYADNSEADVTSKVTWKSGDAAVFSMSKAGVLTAVGKGLTGIEVSYLGATAVATGVVDQPGCTYQVSPVSVSFDRGLNAGSSKVTTQPGCAWTVSPDVDWMTIRLPSGATGIGSGEFQYSVPFRDGPAVLDPREGHAMVRWDTPTAGQNVVVAQLGECHLPFGIAGVAGADGGTTHFSLILWDNSIPISGQHPWQIVSASDWITTIPKPGVWQFGHAATNFAAITEPNPDSLPRVGSIVVCDKTFTLTQAGRKAEATR